MLVGWSAGQQPVHCSTDAAANHRAIGVLWSFLTTAVAAAAFSLIASALFQHFGMQSIYYYRLILPDVHCTLLLLLLLPSRFLLSIEHTHIYRRRVLANLFVVVLFVMLTDWLLLVIS